MKAVRVHAYQQPPSVDDIPEPELRGPLDEGIPQPAPDASTPQSLGLGPSVG